MKKLCEKCNAKFNVDNFHYYKKKYGFSKGKKCIIEKVKSLLRKNYIEKNKLTNHKRRFHTFVVGSKDDDIDNDYDNDFDNDTDNDNIIKNDNDNDDSNVNKLLIVGPCFCGKTYLMVRKILLSEYINRDRQIKISTRSPKQYFDYELTDEILSTDEYKDCVVIFDEMLENKKIDISPFLLVVGMKELLFIIFLSVVLSYFF